MNALFCCNVQKGIVRMVQTNAFMHIRYVYSLRAFCNLIGATDGSRKSDPAQNVIRVTPDPPSVGGAAGKTD